MSNGYTIGPTWNPEEIHRAIATHHHHIPNRDRKLTIDSLALRDVGNGLLTLGFFDTAAIDANQAPRRSDEAC